MNRLDEEILKVLDEAKMLKRDIDFENIGCGFTVEHGSSIDNKAALVLDGYSNNTETSNVFVSDDILYQGTPEERRELNDKLVEVKQKIQEELLEAATEFDDKVMKIMSKYGFKK